MTTKMKRVWRVQPTDGGGWLFGEKLADIIDLIDADADIGGTFKLECVEMPEDEIANASEFDGW